METMFGIMSELSTGGTKYKLFELNLNQNESIAFGQWRANERENQEKKTFGSHGLTSTDEKRVFLSRVLNN